MEWFAGNVEDAVILSKKNKLIFVVGIFGKDETSKKLEEYVNNDVVKTKLENDNDFVCIKVDPDSQDYMNFAQIYRLVPVPSLFFLGADGAPIEIVTAAKTQNDLVNAVENVLKASGKIPIEKLDLAAGTSKHVINASQSLSTISEAPSISSASLNTQGPSSHTLNITSSEIDKVVNEIPNIDIRTAHKSGSGSNKTAGSANETLTKPSSTLDIGEIRTAENAAMNSTNLFTNTSINKSNFQNMQDFLKLETEQNVNQKDISESDVSSEIINNIFEKREGAEITTDGLKETENLGENSKKSDTSVNLNLDNNADPNISSPVEILTKISTDISVTTLKAPAISNTSVNEQKDIQDGKENTLLVEEVSEVFNDAEEGTPELFGNTLGDSSDKNNDENIEKNKNIQNNDESIENNNAAANIVLLPAKSVTKVYSTDKPSTNIKSSKPSASPLNDAISDVQKALQEENNKKKELLDEVKRARMEDDEAKQQILRKIASDKLERLARYGNTDTPKTSSQQQIQVIKPQPIDKESSRIQFRAPDGQSHTHVFNMNEKFSTIREYVYINIIQNSNIREYTLATNFPRHEFVSDDDDKTILELELYPSASILIITNNKPNKAAQVLAESGGLVNMIKSIVWSLVNPIYIIFANLGNYLKGNKDTNQDPNTSSSRSGNLDNKRKSNLINDGASGSDKAKKKTTSSSNIHRLRDSKDSDDDNATWNGNSTQQQ